MPLIEHLEKLRHFHKLTQFNSINECAEAIGISQAGLSKSIASLESVLETPLFVRTNQGLIITPDGELALQATKEILNRANKLEMTLRSLSAAKVPKRLRPPNHAKIVVASRNQIPDTFSMSQKGALFALSARLTLSMVN